jgi:Tol biopolymer transport system component
MEYVAGQTLQEKLAKGPIPLQKALPILIEAAEAIEKAHSAGFIHRDLKPANLMLTPEGHVKVMDFGLAKRILSQGTSEQEVTAGLTREGSTLGTLSYMSPEQIRGEEVDSRSDIFSFGLILYETLTGQHPFRKPQPMETAAAIMNEQAPPLGRYMGECPYRLELVVNKLLAKETDRRYQLIHEARIDLEELAEGTSLEAPAPGNRRDRLGRFAWASFTAVLVVALAVVSALHFVTLTTPESLHLRRGQTPTISPDGKLLVFAGVDEDGVRHLWLRRMDSFTTQKLSRTEGAELPFWSPNSRFIGFFSGGKLKKIAISGGPPVSLADVAFPYLGGTWNREGVILFASIWDPVSRVSAGGGEVTAVTTLDSSRGETAHGFPYFLPDGDHFLYTVRPRAFFATGQSVTLMIGSLTSGESRILLKDSTMAAYDPAGYLVFVQGATLMAQPFDMKELKLTSEPRSVADGVGRLNDQAYFSTSENGILVYRGGSVASRVRWKDREGRTIGSVGGRTTYVQIALSPDGKRALVGGGADIWMIELATDIVSRFSLSPASDGDAIWSPDGQQVLFQSNRNGTADLFRKALGDAAAEMLLDSGEPNWPEDWSPDGQFVIFVRNNGKEVYALDLKQQERPPKLLYETPFQKDELHVSPDGEWIAFSSEESGRWEVYVASFPDFARKRQISSAGGVQPIWRADGKELFYLQHDGSMMSVQIQLGSTIEADSPQALFTSAIAVNPQWNQYCVTADGQRFLMIEPEENEQINVVTNWPENLKRLVVGE